LFLQVYYYYSDINWPIILVLLLTIVDPQKVFFIKVVQDTVNIFIIPHNLSIAQT